MSDKYLLGLKKGDILTINGHQCYINEITCSKTRKNGIRKYHFIGIDINTGIKHETLIPINELK